MNELPCIGFGITVVHKDPLSGTNKLLRARVTGIGEGFAPVPLHPRTSRVHLKEDFWVNWACGSRTGKVWGHDEGTTWTRGHGPQVRAALMASRAMAASR